MKKGYLTLSAVLFFLLSIFSAIAHTGGEKLTAWQRLGLPDPNQIILFSGIIVLLSISYALLMRKELTESHKKALYIIVAISAIIGTIYLSGATVYLNQKSWSGGPVHWHADFEIWVCGEQIDVVDPTGFRNLVGEETMHEHGDNRIHIEGVIFDKEDATLAEFFEALGGRFEAGATDREGRTYGYLQVPTEEGLKGWGQPAVLSLFESLCNGKIARWTVFINGKLVENNEAPDYVISPWQTVPPGDTIKFVFTEVHPSLVKPNLGVPP